MDYLTPVEGFYTVARMVTGTKTPAPTYYRLVMVDCTEHVGEVLFSCPQFTMLAIDGETIRFEGRKIARIVTP